MSRTRRGRPRKAKAKISVEADAGGKPLTQQAEEDVDSLGGILGSGDAMVSTSALLKDMSFGRGVSLSVTVSLRCDQTEEATQDAAEATRVLSLAWAEEGFEEALEVFKDVIGDGRIE